MPENDSDTNSDVLQLFLHAADQHPDAVAVIDRAGSTTYAQLRDHAWGVAAALGPGPGTVGVLTDRSASTVAALLGVLAVDGTYCPIDPSFSAERKRLLAESAQCRTVIATEPSPQPIGVPLLGPHFPDGTAHPMGLEPVAPAYLLFTSGSTGKPKPVITPRTAIAAAVDSLARLFDVRPGDRVLQFASLNWDTSLEEILPTLTSGATLVFDDEAYAGSLPRFLRMLDRLRITVLDLPTAFWHELVHHLTEADGTELPESVRTVVIGGEATSPARLDNWRRLSGADRIRLVNTYGCTETTLVTHAADLYGPRARPQAEAAAPIGRALPHVRELIGEDSELLIGGPALAVGYLGLPEDTAERFLTLAAGRYFRTGDRVRRGADGELHHEGRLDDQIKVRGIRVDPAEVEAQLCAHPAVTSAAATGVPVGDHTTVVAYVTPSARASWDELVVELRAHLRQHSPSHLRPNRITVVPELVHTASGKVDRRRTHQRYATGS
ncbi:amino acid adenylation domain-containing protein [Streptomyces kronopolitis]|uniref:amino acid adenylation domain-containing protein n=1 Tax=Streptomyces kronopolitis TaxID=1612435 RepID=UPI0036CF8CAC